MHLLPFGASILLHEWLVEMFQGSERTTAFFNIKAWFPKTFISVKCCVLQVLNRILGKVPAISRGLGFDFPLDNRSSVLHNIKFFCDQGLPKKLDAKDVDSIDKVSPFLDVIVNAHWGHENADATKTYTSYEDLVQNLYRKHELTEWSEEDPYVRRARS